MFIRFFSEISLDDAALVGGKSAGLGYLAQASQRCGINSAPGFAVTVEAYWYFLRANALAAQLEKLLERLDSTDSKSVACIGAQIRALFLAGQIPSDLADSIRQAYARLGAACCPKNMQTEFLVAVRSSATIEDSSGTSCAGQQESFLSIKDESAILVAYQRCLASLFTDRALVYRAMHGFDHMQIGMAVAVQQMVDAQQGAAGVAFTLDPETGNRDHLIIESVFGFGQRLVQGEVTPDEYRVFKPSIGHYPRPIIRKKLGNKQEKLFYGSDGKERVKELSDDEKSQFCLSDDQVMQLAMMIKNIEDDYQKHRAHSVALDIEWVQSGADGKFYVIQVRPETIHDADKKTLSYVYRLEMNQKQKLLVQGQSVGASIAVGNACVISSIEEAERIEEGDILVTRMTTPDWMPFLRKVGALVTDSGGRTCHAAIVSRELGIPAVVGVGDATRVIKHRQAITVDCSQGATGIVYEDVLAYTKEQRDVTHLESPGVDIMVTLADPDQAYVVAQIPYVCGVGLARIEFIIAQHIGVHPMVCQANLSALPADIAQKLKLMVQGYETARQFFVQKLAQGIGTIAAAFYPRAVLVRFSDFKTNEYAHLLGGSLYERPEQNPMIGLRGASRYYHDQYREAFKLECEALVYARNRMGLTNIACMLPFVRTVHEAEQVLALMKEMGLERGRDGLIIFMMVEIPSNVILFEKFAPLFDGFSIGSNDLTQFVLAVDRDEPSLAEIFDERNEAVQIYLQEIVKKARQAGKYISICGQAPSDYPELAHMLVKAGINSLSLNPDSVIPFLTNYKKATKDFTRPDNNILNENFSGNASI